MLYPDDRTYEGKELRLKQQHFFVSATMQVSICRSVHIMTDAIAFAARVITVLVLGLQDVVRRYKETHTGWEEFPKKVCFQLNGASPCSS